MDKNWKRRFILNNKFTSEKQECIICGDNTKDILGFTFNSSSNKYLWICKKHFKVNKCKKCKHRVECLLLEFKPVCIGGSFIRDADHWSLREQLKGIEYEPIKE